MGGLEIDGNFFIGQFQQLKLYINIKLNFLLLKWERPLNPTDRFFIGQFNNFRIYKLELKFRLLKWGGL